MTESLVTGVMKDAITTALLVAAPLLIAAVIIGLIVSIFQATTQIHEQTLTFLPKLLGMAIIALLVILFFTLLQQCYAFVLSIISELKLR